MFDQTDYRDLLLKYLQFRLKRETADVLPDREEGAFGLEEWDTLNAITEEARAIVSTER